MRAYNSRVSASVPLPHPRGPLGGYRVLDLADEKGQLCARLLGELGADVIKVEPREGHATRANGPFYRDEAGRESSLWWWAMNAGKRSVTCEPRVAAGRELLHRLAAAADAIVETSAPASEEARAHGADPHALMRANPGAVVVSVTNFGQSGPLRDLPATDIVASAMGGHMYLNGGDECGPVRTTVPQAYAQANAQAAVGAVIALYARGANGGLGQHVDRLHAGGHGERHGQRAADVGPAGREQPRARFGAHDRGAAGAALHPPDGGRLGGGAHLRRPHGAERERHDRLAGGDGRGGAAGFAALARAAGDGGAAGGGRAGPADGDAGALLPPAPQGRAGGGAQARGAGWAPVYGPREIVECEQLAARDYWVRVRHDDIGESFVYPGAPFILSRTPWKQRGRAPHVGEHNDDVYGDLLGIDAGERARLRRAMAV